MQDGSGLSWLLEGLQLSGTPPLCYLKVLPEVYERPSGTCHITRRAEPPDQAIAALEQLTEQKRGPGRPKGTAGTPKPRHMTAAARKRIAEAMRKRWAERKQKGN